MRVALNLEQLLHRPPGGIGRYSAELARLLPVDGPTDDDRVEVLPFVARHERVTVEAAMVAFGLEHLDPARLTLPGPSCTTSGTTSAAETCGGSHAGCATSTSCTRRRSRCRRGAAQSSW